MAGNSSEHYVEEGVTILTDSERVEGILFYLGGSRMSDFLNAPIQQENKFLKVKGATVHCRRSGEKIGEVPFVMVSRDRVVMVMTHTSPPEEDYAPAKPPAIQPGAGPARRSFR